MELHLSSISLLFSFFLFLFILIKTLKKSNACNSTLKLPPGPPQLPLIGNLHNLLGSLTHQILRDLANKYGPLMYLKLGQLPTVIVSSPQTAMEFMKTHDIVFAQRPISLVSTVLFYNSTGIVFSPNGDYWRQLRKICIMELLSPKRVQKFRSIREEEVSNLIRSLYSNGNSPVNLSKKIFSLTYGITGRAALGEKNRDQDEFIALVEVILKVVAGFSVAELYPSVKFLQVISGSRPRLEKMHKKMDMLLERIVDEHKKERTRRKTVEEDLVDVLLRIQKHGELEFPLTDNNIKAVIWVSGLFISLTTRSC